MHTQPHTTTTTAWPIFSLPTRTATKSAKVETETSAIVTEAIEAESTALAPISISEKDYAAIAEYIANHCDEVENNYYTCTLDKVDFDLECGATIELTGDATIITDFSRDEYIATGYTGQPERFTAGIDCIAYNEDGDVTKSNFDQNRIKKYI